MYCCPGCPTFDILSFGNIYIVINPISLFTYRSNLLNDTLVITRSRQHVRRCSTHTRTPACPDETRVLQTHQDQAQRHLAHPRHTSQSIYAIPAQHLPTACAHPQAQDDIDPPLAPASSNETPTALVPPECVCLSGAACCGVACTRARAEAADE